MMGLRDGFRHELLTSVIKERINFLQHHTTDRIFAKTNKGIYDNGLIQDLKLFVTCKVPIKNNKGGMFQPDKQPAWDLSTGCYLRPLSYLQVT